MEPILRIDQVIPSLAGRDAIGQHTLRLRDLIRELGLESDIYYANASPEVLRQGKPVEQIDLRPSRSRLLLYQLSTGSKTAEVFAARAEPKLVDYHNIAPSELFEGWEPAIAAELRLGRAQLNGLASHCFYALADSPFNAEEAHLAGYGRTLVAPLLIDFDELAGEPDGLTMARLAADAERGGVDWLFVGKVSPHKAQHDLIKAFIAYRAAYDPMARLHIVGGSISSAYDQALRRLVRHFEAESAVEFAGSVTHGQLRAYYRNADAFVCLSDHEGFCVPLVEAMAMRVPVVAFAAAAVPDTVGDAGVLLHAKDPATVAAAVWHLLSPGDLRRSLVARGERRAASFSLARSTSVFKAVLGQVLECAETGNHTGSGVGDE